MEVVLDSRVFQVTASPQTRCCHKSSPFREVSIYLPSGNEHGQGSYDDATCKGQVVLALRGRVTLDTKVLHATQGGAYACIIADTTGEPIGPDLDDLAGCVVGCIGKADLEEVLGLVEKKGNGCIAGLLRPADTCIGHLLSGNLSALALFEPSHVQDYRDAAGHSILHFAAARDNNSREEGEGGEHILEVLLRHFPSLDLDVQDGVKGQTPLHVAASNGAATAVSILCRHGAQLAPRRSDGRYAVHLAAQGGHVGVLRALHASGRCDLQQRAGDGTTHALLLAAARGSLECTRFLLQLGLGAGGDGESALARASGLALAYLSDPVAAELRYCVTADDEAGKAGDAAALAKQWLLADLGEFVEEDVQVSLNGSSEVADEFVARYRQMAQKCSHGDSGHRPSLAFLWHGCAAAILPQILASGFKTSFANLSFNVYGAGIYFATDAKLSAFFLTRNVREQLPLPPDPQTGRYDILLSCVALGKVGVREALVAGNEAAKSKMKQDLKHPANRNPPLGCDSACGVYMKECVVYENTTAFPFARLSFRLRAGTEVPDPYALDLSTERTYLRPLPLQPRGMWPLYTLAGALTTLDAPPIVVDTDAKLLLGWTPLADDSEVSAEHLMDKIATLELLVQELRCENRRLKAALAARSHDA